jgi:hypothetical protein
VLIVNAAGDTIARLPGTNVVGLTGVSGIFKRRAVMRSRAVKAVEAVEVVVLVALAGVAAIRDQSTSRASRRGSIRDRPR